MLRVSSMLWIGVAVAGAFTLVLGIVHVAIPVLIDAHAAVGDDRSGVPLRRLAGGPFGYRVRRRDVLGLTWVMSNAATYVLVTFGIVDLLWFTGWRGVSLVAAAWIGGWWAIRAGGQFALGHRAGDIVVAAWFATLALLHLAVALAPSSP